jgi:diguanylate cyclase (GGDEF)-like protein
LLPTVWPEGPLNCANEGLPTVTLDIPTLAFVAVCLAVLLGTFLLFVWVQERKVRALAWWGAAYLLGGAAVMLWSVPASHIPVQSELSSALLFVACGMIWNGVRLFHGRAVMPVATFAGAIVWLAFHQLPAFAIDEHGRGLLAAFLVSAYTFSIAIELGRERRASKYSAARTIVVPLIHASIFLVPIVMKVLRPQSFLHGWTEVFVLETLLYAVGGAFIIMLMVKDRSVYAFRSAASTDHLTGLLNRRAFLECATELRDRHRARRQPVTVLMFDLDHFKSVNDRFGHATGDAVLRVFAETARTSMRADDVLGRLGGEEFSAILPANSEIAAMVAERVRAAFEVAGETVDGIAIGGTVSIGAAGAAGADAEIETLLARADAALYQAKEGGRNRVQLAEDIPAVAVAEPASAGLFGGRFDALRWLPPIRGRAAT